VDEIQQMWNEEQHVDELDGIIYKFLLLDTYHHLDILGRDHFDNLGLYRKENKIFLSYV
jgi:hypothetical protein